MKVEDILLLAEREFSDYKINDYEAKRYDEIIIRNKIEYLEDTEEYRVVGAYLYGVEYVPYEPNSEDELISVSEFLKSR